MEAQLQAGPSDPRSLQSSIAAARSRWAYRNWTIWDSATAVAAYLQHSCGYRSAISTCHLMLSSSERPSFLHHVARASMRIRSGWPPECTLAARIENPASPMETGTKRMDARDNAASFSCGITHAITYRPTSFERLAILQVNGESKQDSISISTARRLTVVPCSRSGVGTSAQHWTDSALRAVKSSPTRLSLGGSRSSSSMRPWFSTRRVTSSPKPWYASVSLIPAGATSPPVQARKKCLQK